MKTQTTFLVFMFLTAFINAQIPGVVLKPGRQQHLNTPNMPTGQFTTNRFHRKDWDCLKSRTMRVTAIMPSNLIPMVPTISGMSYMGRLETRAHQEVSLLPMTLIRLLSRINAIWQQAILPIYGYGYTAVAAR